MENWKVGDTALCVKVGPLPYQDPSGKWTPALRLKGKYLVNGLHRCNCGSISLDVGLVNIRSDKGVNCECGAVSAPTDIHWCASIRFVKEVSDSNEEENVEEQLREAVESGNQQLVDELLDKLKLK
jgi:hypothetical protein